MSWYRDLDTRTMVASGDHVRAIGWLTSGEPFQQGEVPSTFLSRLDEFVRLAGPSAEALSFPAFGGFHECELCDRPTDRQTLGPRGSGNLGVPDGPVLYVAPELVSHYIRVHGYRPPSEFMAAVMASPLPDTPEYQALVEPFARLHCAEQEQAYQRRIEYVGRWAVERGGTDEAVREASSRFFGHSLPEMCERIRQAMPNADASPGGSGR